MSIRYKFRSSINFDTLRLDGDKLTISIGELRWKIMCLKKLNDCPRKDFDLVLSDAVTGEAYNDDRIEVASGSSVIVKRVPAETVPSSTFRYKRIEENELRDNNRKGLDQHKPKNLVPQENLEPDSNKQINLENLNSMDPLGASLPSKPKCHLCNLSYKKAVTTKCCYRSLCEKCTHDEPVVKGRCPLCSNKCDELQPNVGLNRTIQHIHEPRTFVDAAANNFQKYAPDQESGIQGKDLATPITKRNTDIFELTSTLMKKSDQDTAESEYNFMMPQDYVHVQGGDQSGSRHNKVDRRCYNCGSPDHLIRNCPIMLNPHHMFQAGDPMFQGGMPSYATPYWGGGAFLTVDPYMHMYGTQGMAPFGGCMAPFGGSMAPITPYSLPNYLPAMGSSLPVPSGTMMGGLTAHSENLEPRQGDNRRMSSDKNRYRKINRQPEKVSSSDKKKDAES